MDQWILKIRVPFRRSSLDLTTNNDGIQGIEWECIMDKLVFPLLGELLGFWAIY